MVRSMLTMPGGPVVVSEKTLGALVAIRRENLVPQLYTEPVVMARSNFESLSNVLPKPPTWLNIHEDRPDVGLPAACETASESEVVTLRLALAPPPDRASIVLLEGPIKERAKLSFIKAEGVVSLLVAGYRYGKLSAVQPMVKALQKLGYADVLPESTMLEALWRAIDDLD